MSASDDETYTIPIKDQRYFGAGLKRTRVKFVPASSPATPQPAADGPAVADLYLSIVGGGKKPEPRPDRGQDDAQPAPKPERCAVCDLPLVDGHQSTLAHQVCVQHSHPPSAIERTRKGLSFLQAQGWDPDARKGLGKAGEGILHPIKPKRKDNTVGLGCVVPKNTAPKAKVEKQNAKEARRIDDDARRRREQLQRLFYSSDDVLRYLGEG
ncbi:g-patch domain-containing protein [Diplodia corticola]|uniref:G-patch domain-containing protein n=1 Tax=Diplodia corticola TaxID=236234 RepID=A0A1J9RYJ0_9PEZI|nr:g-patch domain-containing protein [Diplodia corticola]OJD37731.1 g-patch domain-containing protein [Diplodia corticola]